MAMGCLEMRAGGVIAGLEVTEARQVQRARCSCMRCKRAWRLLGGISRGAVGYVLMRNMFAVFSLMVRRNGIEVIEVLLPRNLCNA